MFWASVDAKGSAYVVDSEGRPVGMVTQERLAGAVGSVGTAASNDFPKASASTPLAALFHLSGDGHPVAVVDVYADAHGVREAAEAFVRFLYTPEAQAIFASKGYRPPVLKSITTAEVEEGEERFVTQFLQSRLVTGAGMGKHVLIAGAAGDRADSFAGRIGMCLALMRNRVPMASWNLNNSIAST